MGKLIVSAGIALASAIICFFLSVAFLCFVLLIIGAVTHNQPDMTLTYKAASPVALLAGVCAFTISLVKMFRAPAEQK
jgi:hypothetical protein